MKESIHYITALLFHVGFCAMPAAVLCGPVLAIVLDKLRPPKTAEDRMGSAFMLLAGTFIGAGLGLGIGLLSWFQNW